MSQISQFMENIYQKGVHLQYISRVVENQDYTGFKYLYLYCPPL